MQIYINNKATEVQAQTVAGLTAELGLPERGVAVAIANRMVPRSEWSSTSLTADAQVTIIKAAFGG